MYKKYVLKTLIMLMVLVGALKIYIGFTSMNTVATGSYNTTSPQPTNGYYVGSGSYAQFYTCTPRPNSGYYVGSGSYAQFYTYTPRPTNTPTPTHTNTSTNTPTYTPTNPPTNTATNTPTTLANNPLDVNSDGAVNMTDVMAVAQVFNTVKGGVRYVAAFDFNNDGAVNMSDIMILAAKFNTLI